MKAREKRCDLFRLVCAGLAAAGAAASNNNPSNDAATNADADANPYGTIVLRNVFGLSDAVVALAHPRSGAAAERHVDWSLDAYVRCRKADRRGETAVDARETGARRKKTYIMNQGRAEGQLELVRINMKSGTPDQT